MPPTPNPNWNDTLTALPVSHFFSEATWAAIERFLTQGSRSQRGYRLLEFFKALDWLPLEGIEPNPLNQFSPAEAQAVRCDVARYLQDKASKRHEQRTKRESYRLRVFEYFRAHVSQSDKVLLEHLRDFELELMGDDVNWRHYFWFTSFKQIDAFTGQNATERQTRIEQFKNDVEQRHRNAERLRNGTYAQYYWGEATHAAPESFDEWVNQNAHRVEMAQPRAAASPGRMLTPEQRQAFHTLALHPTATLPELRQRFRELTLRHHPDRPDGDSDTMRRILAAYDVLKKTLRSPEKR